MNRLFFLLLLFLPGFVFSQSLSAEKIAAIDSTLFPVERLKKPGYIVTILQDNHIVYNRATGYINIRKRLPFTIDSRVALASVSKQFTAMGIHLLEQEGKLSLNDEVHKYIPELPKYAAPILIKHLLSHTSGIRDHITIRGWENNQQSHIYHFNGTLDVLKNYCWTSFLAGEDFAYSNTGYVLLALIIERVSGQPFEKFMEKRIFDPLDMTSTEFSFRRKGEEYGHSTAYAYNAKRKQFRMFKIREVNALGATGIYTTVSDMIKWDRNFTHPIVGNAELIGEMQLSDTLNNGMSVHYNNGLKHRTEHGLQIIEHSGGWANYNIQYVRIPEMQMAFIIATNNEFDYPIGMGEQLLDILLPDETRELSAPITFESTGLREGYYLSDNMTLRQVINDHGIFKLRIPEKDHEKLFTIHSLPKDSCYQDNEFHLFCPGNNSFLWYGGTYFNTPRVYELMTSDQDFDYKATSGRYANCEMGGIRLKYHPLKDDYLMIGSLIKRIRLKKVTDGLYESKKKGFKIRFVDPYTFLLGNNRVFGLEFKRVED